MVFVVVGDKGNHRALVLHLAAEHLHVPVQHLLEAVGAIDDMGECLGANVG